MGVFYPSSSSAKYKFMQVFSVEEMHSVSKLLPILNNAALHHRDFTFIEAIIIHLQLSHQASYQS